MRAHPFRICLAHKLRRNLYGFTRFEILEQNIGFEIRIELLGIEHLEQHDVLALPGERAHAVEDLVDIAVEVGNHSNEAAPRNLFAKLVERLIKFRAGSGLRRINAMQNALQFAGPGCRCAIVSDFFVKYHAANRVMLS